MAALPWRDPPLTREQEEDLFMLMLEDDEEDSPWMVMGDLQFWSASSFAHSLRAYAHEQGLPWYVAAMLPIEYRWRRSRRKKKLAPDTFVAFVPERARTSYDLESEGPFPAFVLEVVSPSSTERDQEDKRIAYELLGAQEYALFTPREGVPSMLDGFRRNAAGVFETWTPDAGGRLWSDVLELYLVAHGPLLRAETPEGRALLSPEEETQARRRAQADRQAADAARQGEAEARRRAEAAQRRAEEAQQRAEEENARLRHELEGYRGRPGDAG
jgi:Uma2 family endonuclease